MKIVNDKEYDHDIFIERINYKQWNFEQGLIQYVQDRQFVGNDEDNRALKHYRRTHKKFDQKCKWETHSGITREQRRGRSIHR